MRVKQAWVGRLNGAISTNGRMIEIPIKLENDPTRKVVVIVPGSKIEGLLRQLGRAWHEYNVATSSITRIGKSSTNGGSNELNSSYHRENAPAR